MFYPGSNDPLLYNDSSPRPQTPNNLSDLYAQLYTQQKVVENQQQCIRDYLGELDSYTKELDSNTMEVLCSDGRFNELNAKLQFYIQSELMSLVKYKLNTNPQVVENIKCQLDLIKSAQNNVKEKERQNISEINDYMKNYSNMTFDEYKKMKFGNNKQTKKTKNDE